jgi:hypothetical protein
MTKAKTKRTTKALAIIGAFRLEGDRAVGAMIREAVGL